MGGPVAEKFIPDLIFRDLQVREFLHYDWFEALTPQELLSHVALTIMGLLENKILTPQNGEKFSLDNYVDAIAKSQVLFLFPASNG